MADFAVDLPKPDPTDPQYMTKVLELCKLAELTDRHEDMCQYLHMLIEAKNGDLNEDERNLFSVGFKSVVGNLRRGWRNLSQDDGADKAVQSYKSFIKNRIDSVCSEVVSLITDKILPSEEGKPQGNSSAEAQTFYHKMIGDYERYKAELDSEGSSGSGERATNAYKKALQIAEPLSDTDSTKLGLALNYSVCLYEIAKNKAEAVNVAKAAFDNALKKLDDLDESDYKNSTLIMQLLRDNLTLWTTDSAEEPTED